MISRTMMRTMFGVGAAACMMALSSCGGGEENGTETKPKTEVEIAQELLDDAQKQYEADSTAFVQAAPDSAALKARLANLQQMRTEYLRLNEEDTENVGKQFNEYYKKLAENVGEEVPVDSNLVKMDKAIKEAQLKADIATGKVAQNSKQICDKRLKKLEELKQLEIKQAEEAKEQARQDSIRRANLENDPLHQMMIEYQKQLEYVQKEIKIQKELQKQEFEKAKQAKQLVDSITKPRKDSIVQEFLKLQNK